MKRWEENEVETTGVMKRWEENEAETAGVMKRWEENERLSGKMWQDIEARIRSSHFSQSLFSLQSGLGRHPVVDIHHQLWYSQEFHRSPNKGCCDHIANEKSSIVGKKYTSSVGNICER